jgi:uncharacterized protein
MTNHLIGIVKEINLFPVKSMRGVSVEHADVYWYGLNGDRKYAFIHDDAKSGFPWLTAREHPKLLQYQPYFVDPTSPLKSEIRILTPAGADVALSDLQGELARAYPKPISLLKLMRGTFDCMPVSIISSSSISTLETFLGEPLDGRRFRSNILLETESTEDFPEHSWLNQTLVFGEHTNAVRMAIHYQTKRCVMVNLQPETGESNSGILKIIAQLSSNHAGVYGSLQTLGTIRVGDNVYLQKPE